MPNNPSKEEREVRQFSPRGMKKCRELECVSELSIDSPEYCPVHNWMNNKCEEESCVREKGHTGFHFDDRPDSPHTPLSWKENLRDLYLHSDPDENGLSTASILMNIGKFTFDKRVKEKIEFYLLSAETLESFISALLAEREESLRGKIEGMKESAKKYPMRNEKGEMIDWNNGYRGAMNQVLKSLLPPNKEENV